MFNTNSAGRAASVCHFAYAWILFAQAILYSFAQKDCSIVNISQSA